MSEEWREGEGDNGMSRFGAFSAIPYVLAFWAVVVALVFVACGCSTVEKAWELGSRYKIEKREAKPDDAQPTPQANVMAIPRVDVWHGGDLSGAQPDARCVLTLSDGGRTWSAYPDDWQGGLFPARCVVAYPEGGQTHAGYYDWLPRPPRRRDFKNFAGNQNGIRPPAGVPLTFWLVEGNGRRRSANVLQLVWDGHE